LERDIYLFIVDMYSRRFHKGLKAIPAEEWQRKTSHPSFFFRLPKSARELMILLGRSIERSIWKYGFNFETITYNCDELAVIRERLGKKKAKIKFHPGDLSRMYVYDELNKNYIEVLAVDPEGYTKNLSLWKHRFLRKLARQHEDRPDIIALGRTRRKFKVSANNKSKKGVLRRRQIARHESVPPSIRENAVANHDVPLLDSASVENSIDDMSWLDDGSGYTTEFSE
jgi:putative transposase